jgi:hypothetical protein
VRLLNYIITVPVSDLILIVSPSFLLFLFTYLRKLGDLFLHLFSKKPPIRYSTVLIHVFFIRIRNDRFVEGNSSDIFKYCSECVEVLCFQDDCELVFKSKRTKFQIGRTQSNIEMVFLRLREFLLPPFSHVNDHLSGYCCIHFFYLNNWRCSSYLCCGSETRFNGIPRSGFAIRIGTQEGKTGPEK